MKNLNNISMIKKLGEIAASMSSIKTLKELADEVETVLEELIEFDNDGLYLFDPIVKKLKLFHAKGFSEEERLEAEMTAMERHPGKLFREARELYIPDVESDQEGLTQDSKRSFNVRTRLYFPVMKNNECIGTFGITSSKVDAFSDIHKDLLWFICNLAGIAYQNIVSNLEIQKAPLKNLF